jgi:hypothetical protein
VAGLYHPGEVDVFFDLYVSAGRPGIVRRNTTIINVESATAYINVWTHCVAVFSGVDDARLYVNGRLATNDTRTVATSTSATRLSIGRRGDSTPDSYFTGNVDEVRVYANTLPTDEEIKQLYLIGKKILNLKGQ